MERKKVFAALLPALILSACNPSQGPQDETGARPTSSPDADASMEVQADARPGRLTGPEADDRENGNPDLTPPALTPQAERGLEGARNILLSFARAIERKEYGQAWSLLSAADKKKWNRTGFAAIFADLGGIRVAIPDGAMEGAAGSIYYTAPVVITGNDDDGRPLRIEGEAVLRRVNDVEGATPAQLRWHFARLTLDSTH